ncbi:MAG TPA: nucleotidyltransferase family protein [Gemmatimonadaceae bacterium]
MLGADLDARSRRWAVTNDPTLLWPDLDLNLLSAAATKIERNVARVLDGRTTSLGAADGTDAYAIGIASLLSGTGPILGYWVEQGLVDVAAPLAAILARHLQHGRGRLRRIEREITPALERLVECGAKPGILKGFHTAHVYYPEPGLRPLADVDVYVKPANLQPARDALASAGFGPGSWSAEFKSNWYPDEWVPPTRSLEFWHVRSPWRIELHTALQFGTLIRHGIRLEAEMPVAEPWEWNGIPLVVTPQPLLMVALAAHLSSELNAARLIRLIELNLIIRRDTASGKLDWGGVTDFLERTRATRYAYPAFALVEQLAPGTIDPTVLALTRKRSTRIARVVVAELTPATPILHDHVSLAERLMWEPGVIGIVRRLLEMLVPSHGESFRQDVAVYVSRFRRLLTGRVSWRIGRRTGKSAAVRA